MRHASVYQRRGCYFIHAVSYTTERVGILSGPAIAVFAEGGLKGEGLDTLGQAILLALGGSRSGVPHPIDWKTVPRSMLSLAGVKSWNAFVKYATCIDVHESEGGTILLTPLRSLGPREGSEPVPSKRVSATRADPSTVGGLAVKLLGEAAEL